MGPDVVATHKVFFAEAGQRRRGCREDNDLSSGRDELRARHPRMCSSDDVIGGGVHKDNKTFERQRAQIFIVGR